MNSLNSFFYDLWFESCLSHTLLFFPFSAKGRQVHRLFCSSPRSYLHKHIKFAYIQNQGNSPCVNKQNSFLMIYVSMWCFSHDIFCFIGFLGSSSTPSTSLVSSILSRRWEHLHARALQIRAELSTQAPQRPTHSFWSFLRVNPKSHRLFASARRTTLYAMPPAAGQPAALQGTEPGQGPEIRTLPWDRLRWQHGWAWTLKWMKRGCV